MDEDQTSSIDDTTEDLDTDGAKNSAKDAYSTGKDIAKKIKDSANKKDDEDGEEGASKSKKGGSENGDSTQYSGKTKNDTANSDNKSGSKTNSNASKQGADASNKAQTASTKASTKASTSATGAGATGAGAAGAGAAGAGATGAGAAGAGAASAGAASAGAASAGAAGGISSLVAFFATPVGWVILVILLIILIVILVIGAIGFFMTMPGLMLEKVSQFFNNAIKDIYRDPTSSTEIVVDEDAKIELANYIQDLGYDVVGTGFLESVKKDDEGKITEIKAGGKDYLYAYILSNERIYTLDGENDTLWNQAKDVLKSIYVPGYYWHKVVDGLLSYDGVNPEAKKGMLKIHWGDDGNKLLNQFDTIDINPEDKTMIMKRWNPDSKWNDIGTWGGITSVDTWEWDLDGWSGRYGKPLELSLALHLSTMAPDFVYDFCMDKDLQTAVNINLNSVEYSVKYKYVTNNGETISSDEIEEEYNILSDAVKNFEYNRAATSQNIKIPDVYDEQGNPILSLRILTDTNVIISNPNNDGSNEYYKALDKDKKPVAFYDEQGNCIIKNYMFAWDTNQEDNGVNFSIPEDGNSNITGSGSDYFANGNIINIKALCMEDILRLIKSDKEITREEESLIKNSVNLMSVVAINTIDKYIDETADTNTYNRTSLLEKYNEEGFTYTTYSGLLSSFMDFDKDDKDYYATIYEDITKAIMADYDIAFEAYKANISVDSEKLNKWGINFETLGALFRVLCSEEAKTNLETYQPYISYVKNHWYKDVYFDPSKYRGTNEELKSMSIEDVYKFGNTENIENVQYTPQGTAADAIKDDLALIDDNGNMYADLTPTSSDGTIVQTGQPGITQEEKWHYKVKNWLMNGYFFIYDGTVKTAEEIQSAREKLKGEYDPADPLLGVDGGTSEIDVETIDQNAKKLNDKLKEAGYNVRLQKISFAKKSSLAAFSILESVHTRDAEYVYRDLKELLIELEYFTKEDFELVESNVLVWLIPDYSPTQWPSKKYEKKDTEYGTYILSAKEVEKIKKGDNTSGSTTDLTDEDSKDIGITGFSSGSTVVAPANAVVHKVSEDGKSITLKFTVDNKVKDMTLKIDGINVTVNEGDEILQHEQIGTTTDESIKLLLRDKKKAIINNIEDYIILFNNTSGVVANGDIEEQVAALQTTGIDVGSWVDSGNYKNAMKYIDIVEKYAPLYGLDSKIVIALIADESGGNPNANSGTAYGLMQFENTNSDTITVTKVDGTTRTFTNTHSKVKSGDADFQIELGCAMFKQKLDEFNGNLPAAIQAYNYGSAGLRRCVSYHIAGHTNTQETYCGISQEQYYEYLGSGDLGWLEDRHWYSTTGYTAFGQGGGTEKYLEYVLNYYNL